MKFSLAVTISLPNYQNIKVGVTEADSIEDCEKFLKDYIHENKLPVDPFIEKTLKM